MLASSREEIVGVFDALDASVDRLCGLSFDALTTVERLAMLERLERVRRRLPVPGHALINQLGEQADRAELGGRLPRVLADRLHITCGEASRRVGEAAVLGPRRALTGQVLGPLLVATAKAQRDGHIGDGHVQVIARFVDRLPSAVDVGTREHAEAQLAELAAGLRPDEVVKLAHRLTDYLNPDGEDTERERGRRRGLRLSVQDVDGMSRLGGWVTPELRAGLEAIWAKLAAPGMGNPDDQTAAVDGQAGKDGACGDARSEAQRNHDGLNAAVRAILASGELGQHNGLPVTIIVSTTLGELESGAGKALTGGGSVLPMADVIRLAGHAHHYLAIFDKGEAVGLFHTKRLASPGQRIVLYAKDRGCSAPGCAVPGYLCEAHHVEEFAHCRQSHIDNLTFACGQHHRLLAPGGWTTRKRANGDTEWIPPPHLDHGQPRTNAYHHPEKLLCDSEDDACAGAA